jgi:hypothetical protein
MQQQQQQRRDNSRTHDGHGLRFFKMIYNARIYFCFFCESFFRLPVFLSHFRMARRRQRRRSPSSPPPPLKKRKNKQFTYVDMRKKETDYIHDDGCLFPIRGYYVASQSAISHQQE